MPGVNIKRDKVVIRCHTHSQLLFTILMQNLQFSLASRTKVMRIITVGLLQIR